MICRRWSGPFERGLVRRDRAHGDRGTDAQSSGSSRADGGITDGSSERGRPSVEMDSGGAILGKEAERIGATFGRDVRHFGEGRSAAFGGGTVVGCAAGAGGRGAACGPIASLRLARAQVGRPWTGARRLSSAGRAALLEEVWDSSQTHFHRPDCGPAREPALRKGELAGAGIEEAGD